VRRGRDGLHGRCPRLHRQHRRHRRPLQWRGRRLRSGQRRRLCLGFRPFRGREVDRPRQLREGGFVENSLARGVPWPTTVFAH
jgi:hypothetical protein